MAVPGIVYLVPRYVVMAQMGLVNNFLGLWIPYAASSFMILVLNNAFDQIPRDLYEAAQIDGASEIRMFTSITIPLSSSVLLVLGLFVFHWLLGRFSLAVPDPARIWIADNFRSLVYADTEASR